MSKLYNIYLEEKKKNSDILLLFKSGIFYIAIAEDAIKLSNLLHLKLTNLNDTIQKCGFPCSSSNKYFHLFNILNIDTKIIDIKSNTTSTVDNTLNIDIIRELLIKIKKVDLDSLSVSDSYKFIEDLKRYIDNNNL